MKFLLLTFTLVALSSLSAHAESTLTCETRVNDGEWKSIQADPHPRASRAYWFFEHFNAGPRAIARPRNLDEEMFEFDASGQPTFDGKSQIEIEYAPKKNRVSIRIHDDVSNRDYALSDRPKKDETYEVTAEDPSGLFGGSGFRKIEVRCDFKMGE